MDFNVCDCYSDIQWEDSQPVDLHHQLHHHHRPDKQSEQKEKKEMAEAYKHNFHLVNIFYVILF